MSMKRMRYGKAIKIIRTAREMSQKDLAAKCDLNASYVSLIEADERTPSAGALEKIARVLRVPFYLLTLLASGPEQLKGLPVREAQRVGTELLDLLVGATSRPSRG